MRILLTGASGFVGRHFLDYTDELDVFDVVACVRSNGARASHDGYYSTIGGIDSETDWKAALNEVDVVVHCAARVHIMNDKEQDPLSAFREVNVDGTANLALQAANAGVKRFVFLSSIKVNGEFSGDKCFGFDDTPAPEDPYGVSKRQAEERLKGICDETGMEYVIIRPPLVYGAGVKANFLSMLKWVSRGVPLPLGGIRNNKRSLVYVESLVDLIRVCMEHPAAANQTFLVSDDDDVSTSELLERIAKALGVESRLLPVPPSWLGFVGKLLGKKDIEQRLCGSLQVDIDHTKKTLDWKPPYSMEDGLLRTAEWYKQHNK